jgi:hypothetical protein
MYVPRARYSLTMSFWSCPQQLGLVDAALARQRHVQRQEPHRGGVDRHRRVHPLERDAVEQHVHVAEMR